MGDAGEGLIDADTRIQERMEELERERRATKKAERRDPEQVRVLESLKLARTELERQLGATTHEARRGQLTLAIEEVDRRLVQAMAASSRR